MIDEEGKRTLLHLAILAALDAGKEILDVYGQGAFNVESKDDKSPLTEADKRAHQAIQKQLEKSGYPVLSEEGAEIPFETRKNWSHLWIVDPLDGTKEFIKRNGEFTVNIALIENGKPILGVVYVPIQYKVYFSAVGLDSWMSRDCEHLLDEWENDWEMVADRLPDYERMQDRPYTVVASRSHASPETDAFIESLEQEHPDLELTSIGSSLKICLVAEGVADIYPRFAPTMEWDTAAGHAVVLGMGKNLYDHSTGQSMVYNREQLRNNWFVVK
jgi:3'(2'), 5'-bisphosphate nucleotidase